MLSIKWIENVDYYLDQATPDYYFRPGEPPGRWFGLGTKPLGLSGTVQPEALKALCRGFSPQGIPLIQNAGASNHQQAWDLTFSAPKPVSVLWSQASRATRIKIRKIHHKAVKKALGYLTDAAMLTRRGKGGRVREQALPIFAIFEHGSNRELEPQLHSHCVLVNAAGRADGTFGTILSEPIYRHKMAAGALYQAELAHLLRSQLGLKLEKQPTGFGIVGVPKELVDHYSTRSKQIKNKLRSHGSHSAKAAATAALDTRKSKRKSPPPRAELFKRWQATNERFGFSEQSVQRILGSIAADVSVPDLKNRITAAVEEILNTESFFSEQRLIRQTANAVIAEGVSATEIIKQVKEFILEDKSLVPLGSFKQEAVFTTREMLALETELQAAIDDGKNDGSHVIKKSVVDSILTSELPLTSTLSEDERLRNQEQCKAVIRITARPGDAVVEGMAGTGKTRILKVARQTWQRGGKRVIGIALSAAAAANLQAGSGIESDTLALRLRQLDRRQDFARHHKRQVKRFVKGKRTYAYDGPELRLDRNTIIVLDEAGMVGTRQMAKLLKHARKAGAKLVLVGDRRQLQPIDAGGPFPFIADQSNKADLQHVIRQRIERDDPNPTWHRETGRLIAAGHPARALELFAQRGRFTVHDERDQAMVAIARDWSVGGIADPTSHLVLAGTTAEVSELNSMCQSARLSAGALGTEHATVAGTEICTGDVVLFTKNSRLYKVKNGDRGVVVAFNRLTKTMAVRLPSAEKPVLIPYASYKEIQLGYAMTTHKAQGATMPSVYVLLGGPMQDRHLSYVQATRATESTRLYVDRLNAGPELKHLLNQMSKDRPKLLAHDVLKSNISDGAASAPSNPTATPKSSSSGDTKKPKPPKRNKRPSNEPQKPPDNAKHEDARTPRKPIDIGVVPKMPAGSTTQESKWSPTSQALPVTPPKTKSAPHSVKESDAKSPVPPPQHIPPTATNRRDSGINTTKSPTRKPKPSNGNELPNETQPAHQAANKSSVEPASSTPPRVSSTVTAPRGPEPQTLEPTTHPSKPREVLDQAQPPLVPFQLAAPATPLLRSQPSKHGSSASPSSPPLIPPQPIKWPFKRKRRRSPTAGMPEAMPSDQLGDEISPLEYDFAIPIEPPARDIFDVSHIDVASTTDVKVLSEAIARYGKLPGGIVVEGEARCDTPINTLEVNAKRPTQLVINGNCDFDTGLSPEEVALICHAVLGTGQADKDFGALSQRQAIGIDNDTVVAETMMNADNALGGTIYGYDSAYALGQAMFPSYQNPFVAEAEAATHHSEVIERLFFNYIEQLHVQVFLKVTNVRFSTRSQGRLTVSSSKITAAIGAMTGEGKPATTMLGEPLAPFSFPFVHKTLQAFLANLGTYARNEPRIARTIAYAELVSLLRCAKKARASYFGHEHVSRLIAIRRRAPLPRFNYTRRSTEFAEVAGRVARELSETSSTRFQGLMAETVGLVFATLAGNFELFETCKSHVLRSIEHLQKKSHFGTRYYDPSQKLPELADRVRGTCHDAVIAACLNAAREKGQTPDERTTYLKDVLRLCDPVSKYLANSVTRCRCVEAKSYLEPGFDPLPELIQVRRDDPSTMQPFSVLARIKEYRRDEPDVCDTPDKTLRAIVKRQHQLGFSQLAVEKQSLWSMLRSGMSDQGALWLLDELQRFDLPLNDYLGMACTYKDPLEALRQLLFARLKLLPATSFSTRFLHRNNLFVGSHELLDHETRQALSAHFSSVRDKVEGFDFLLPRKKSRLQKVLSTFLPLDLQDWWAQFLRTNATFQDTDASKVAILLACELRLRGRTVGELYDKMRKYRTWNPQAALFLLDIDDAKEAAMLASFRQHMKERSSSI